MSDLFEPMPGPPGRWGRRVAIALVAVVVLGLVGGGIALIYVKSQVDPSGPAGRHVTVEIPQGSSTARIASILDAEGVVTNARNFRLYVRVKGEGPFQAGSYTLRQRSSFGDVVKVLEKGPKLTFQRLTVPEGLTVKQVAERVGRMPGRSAEKFLAVVTSGQVRSKYQPAGSTNLEGLLFPDTYNFEPKDDEKAIVERMVRSFEEAAAAAGIDQVAEGGLVDPYQAIIVASLVEREARVAEERGKVARVIYNRLAKNMLLQVDATVIYALGKSADRNVRVLFKDLEVDSPYNTYKVKGLPPTPIAAPGEASLQAALNPEPGPFLFYVVTEKDGRHSFATTDAEHGANIRKAQANGMR